MTTTASSPLLKVFIPGRVCMLGEHSDWSSSYRSQQHSHIHPGACIAYNTDCGIELEGKTCVLSKKKNQNEEETPSTTNHNNYKIHFEYEVHEDVHHQRQQNNNNNKTTTTSISPKVSVPLDYDSLIEYAKKEGEFFAHVCATAAEMLQRFGQDKIHENLKKKYIYDKNSLKDEDDDQLHLLLQISCTSMSLPMKKGLSSSAAIAVGLAKLIGQMSDIPSSILTENELMDIAYHGERRTGSQCGRLDQVVAHGPSAFVKLSFNNHNNQNASSSPLACDPIRVSTPFYFVVCDLKASKDTKVILRDLNSAFPIPQDDIDKAVHEALGPQNLRLINEAEIALSKGDSERLGRIFSEAQEVFDKMIAPKCKQELSAPKLHRVLEHEDVRKNSLGGKGVGSQGDGSAQFVCKDAEQQDELCRILREVLDCAPMKFNLKP